MKPIILSPYMANIDQRVVKAQADTLAAIAPNMPILQVRTDSSHGDTVDYMLRKCIQSGYDTALLLDIDAVPYDLHAIEYTLRQAHKGILIGNVQRSNHIDNDQHLFVAPSFMGISLYHYGLVDMPSFVETKRGDVAEEVTYAWEQNNLLTEFYMPLQYENPPAECPFWKLRDDMPVYGCGTTFGTYTNIGTRSMSYHAFQIRMGRNVENFLAKCASIIKAQKKV